MHSIASSAGLRRLFATSILARLPLAMLSIGLLVHAQHLTGSFAAAGVVTGVYAIALGVGGPLLGQLVDRRGQTSVLLASATVAAALLVAIAVQPVGASLAVLLALAAGIGLADPAGRRLPANPTSSPSIRSQRRPRRLRPRGVRRRADVYLRAAARALHRCAVVHRRGPRGGWDRPAARDHGVRRATGLTQLATGAGGNGDRAEARCARRRCERW